ncbi:hypothetical protein FQA39_LY12001 [Lamprigera yunnana]|nr:hypothetical protein FQA39_LY12001 [Lamprigera yunnana]
MGKSEDGKVVENVILHNIDRDMNFLNVYYVAANKFINETVADNFSFLLLEKQDKLDVANMQQSLKMSTVEMLRERNIFFTDTVRINRVKGYKLYENERDYYCHLVVLHNDVPLSIEYQHLT